MSTPQPPIELQGHCSVINNETLYVYSPNAFQALPLKKNATWSEMPMGVSTTGAACVKAVPNGDEKQAVLYVVGGSSEMSDYSGLQKYTFANKSWETIQPATEVTQNRQNHGAAYLNSSSSILVYGGSQVSGDSSPSSQTFLISANSPYGVQSYTSSAPPVVAPVLLPWNDSHAVMLGGGVQNKRVFTFGKSDGWQPLATNMTEGLASAVQCTLVQGDDGSKVLEAYNMGVSPNEVTQMALLVAGGRVAAPPLTLGASRSRKRKRDLTIANWPAYNNTLAPKSTRSDFALAQDPNGLVVLSGGNAQSPLSVFDQRQNSWQDSNQLFSESVTTPSSSVASSATAPTSSATGAAATPSNSGDSGRHRRIALGASLGVVCGIAVLLILLLLIFRWRKQRQKRERPGYVDEKNTANGDRLSFADRGASFMKEAGGSMANLPQQFDHPPNPRYTSNSNGSHSSLAIMAGKIGGSAHTRNDGPKGSFDSTAGLVYAKKSPLGNGESHEMRDYSDSKASSLHPDGKATRFQPRFEQSPPAAPLAAYSGPNIVTQDRPTMHGKKRSSGWSKYFLNNEGTNLASASASNNRSVHDSAYSESQYTHSRFPSQTSHVPSSHPSIVIPPLDLDFSAKFDGQRLSRVATGSPALGHSREHLPSQGQKAELERSDSVNAISSFGDDPHDSLNSTGVPSQLFEGSTASAAASKGDSHSRPISSTYTDSAHGTRFPPRIDSAAGDRTLGNRDYARSFYPPRAPDNTLPNFNPREGTSLDYHARSPEPPLRGIGLAKTSDGRDSSVTLFPGGSFPSPVGRTLFPGSNAFAERKAAAASASASASALGLDPLGLDHNGRAEDRDSTITVFPSGVAQPVVPRRPSVVHVGAKGRKQTPPKEDMSWLNLGDGKGT
ncbi:hypothetical protein BJ546DRAFT_1062053 [Cryomyces antarcticus]